MKINMKKTASLTGLGLTAALMLSACSGAEAEKDPAEVVRTAEQKSSEKKEQSVDISFDFDQDELNRFYEENETTPSTADEAEMRKKVLGHLAESTFSMDGRSTNDQPLQDVTNPQDMDWSLDVKVGDTSIGEMLETGDMDFFFRLDLPWLLEQYSPNGAQELAQMRQQADQMAQQLPFAKALIEAKWIGLDRSLSDTLAQSVEEQSGVDEETFTPEEQQQLQDSYWEHSDVTREEDGRYKVALRVKEFVEANRDLVQKSLDASAESSSSTTAEPTDVQDVIDSLNDGTFDIRWTVENEEFRKAEMDLFQYADLAELPEDATAENKENLEKLRELEFPTTVDYSGEVGDFAVPEDVTELTEGQLSQLGGSTSGSF